MIRRYAAARPTVARAAGTLGALAARIEIRDLPAGTALDGPQPWNGPKAEP